MSRKNKYSKSFKLKAVQKVLKNNLRIIQVCDNLGVSKTALRKWIRYFNQYGSLGLEPRIHNTNYSLDFKAKAIRSIEDDGNSINEVALIYNVPSPEVIGNWYQIYQNKGILGLNSKPKGRPKTMNKKLQRKSSKKPLTREEELLLENESLRAELALLKKLHALAQARKKNQ